MILWAKQKKNGFTIVELLIVIVVIAILAAITIVAYNGVQTRAKASVTTSDLKNIKRAFRLFAVEDGKATWWLDNELTGWGNPKIKSVISATNFGKYMQSLSDSSTDNDWIFDNDGDTYPGCSSGSTAGVNVFVYNYDPKAAQIIDSSIDDGNLSCGSITQSGTTLRYNLSKDQQF